VDDDTVTAKWDKKACTLNVVCTVIQPTDETTESDATLIDEKDDVETQKEMVDRMGRIY